MTRAREKRNHAHRAVVSSPSRFSSLLMRFWCSRCTRAASRTCHYRREREGVSCRDQPEGRLSTCMPFEDHRCSQFAVSGLRGCFMSRDLPFGTILVLITFPDQRHVFFLKGLAVSPKPRHNLLHFP